MSPETYPQDKKWLALALLALAQFVVVLDASIVNVALPSIGRDLEFAQEDLSWVVNAYTLVFGGFLLLGGRMADLIGRRRMFIAGLVVFALASLAGGLATTPGMLIAARAVQGLGAALLSPAALSLVTVMFTEGAERNKAMGVWGAVAGSGGAAGVLLGGVLTEYAGWEWVLFVNVPIGLAAAAFAPRLLPESRDHGHPSLRRRGRRLRDRRPLAAGLHARRRQRRRLDLGPDARPRRDRAGAARACSWSSSCARRRRSSRSRSSSGARSPATNVVALLVAMALFSMFFFVSLYMQQVLGYDALEAGLAYLPLAVGIIVSAGIASSLVTKVGFKPVLIAGLVLTAAGLVWFAQVSVGGDYVCDILFPSLLAAVGLGFAFVPMTIAAVSGVSSQEAGLASGLINTSQQIGGALGLAILASIANSQTDDLMRDRGRRPGGAPGRPDRGLPDRLPRRRRLRGGRRDPGRDADLVAREPRARRGGAARRGRRGGRRRLAARTQLPGGCGRPGGKPVLSGGGVVPAPPPSGAPRRSARPGPAGAASSAQRGNCAVALGVHRHVDVRGEDRDERGDQPPARGPARAGVQHPGGAGELRDPARVHDLAPVPGEGVGHDRLVHPRPEEVQAAGGEEEGGERESSAHRPHDGVATTSRWSTDQPRLGERAIGADCGWAEWSGAAGSGRGPS